MSNEKYSPAIAGLASAAMDGAEMMIASLRKDRDDLSSELEVARKEIASLRAQLEAVATPAQPLHVAATSCPHEIDKDKIVLHFDSKQPGKNALAQLAARLQAAQALDAIVDLAQEAHRHWDADRDAKVGKLLMALSGYSPGYDKRADALHAAMAAQKGNHD